MSIPKHNQIPPPENQDWVCVARIVRPQGHRGEILADALTNHPERFAAGLPVFLRAAGSPATPVQATLVTARPHGERIVMQLSTCASMNDAEALRGFEVLVPFAERWTLDDDEVYIADLTGCTLIDTVSGATIGTIEDVDQESSNTPLLVLKTDGDSETLVPFVKAYAPEWDVAAKTLRMALPNGLLDVNRPQAAPEAPKE